MTEVIACPMCQQTLRVLTDKGTLTARCPKCSHAWDWSPKKLNDDRLADLLLTWEELYEQGKDVTAAELCREWPELAVELAERVDCLKQMAWVKKKTQQEEKGTPDGKKEELVIPKKGVGIHLHGGAEPIPGYRLIKKLGQGAFGEVWSAQSPDELVAIKFFGSSGFPVGKKIR